MGPDPPISQERLKSEMYGHTHFPISKTLCVPNTNTVCPLSSYHCPSSPKVATEKGRMGSPGHADQPSLTGPMAHPSEVIQEAWHCLARNKAETMSNSILVLVKVNFV